MIGRDYLTRQAATLLKLAQITSDENKALLLKAKAAERQLRSVSKDTAPIQSPIVVKEPE